MLIQPIIIILLLCEFVINVSFFLHRKKNKEMLISQKQMHLFHGE